MSASPEAVSPHTRLLHRTEYRYESAVRLGPQLVRLRPLPDPGVLPGAYSLTVDPAPTSMHWQADPFGNLVARLLLPGPIERLVLMVSLELDLTPGNPFDFLLDTEAGRSPFHYAVDVADALAMFRRADHPGAMLETMRDETTGADDTVAFLLRLAGRVVDRVAYITRMEAGVWPPEQTLAEGRGSCRDTAWLLVQLLRLHGIAARFVSGYLVQTPEDGAPRSAELHAWADAYLPGAGWIGLDPTSGLLTAEGHIRLAVSPDPSGAAPLSGTVQPGPVRLQTSINLLPV